MNNPRFPHSLVVKRAKLDVDGDICVDEAGLPIYETLPLTAVRYMDGKPMSENGEYVVDVVESVPFGYRTSSMSTRESGDVIVADFKLACPIFLTELRYDDRIMITDFEHEYEAVLVKKTTFNFGTNVWINEVHN